MEDGKGKSVAEAEPSFNLDEWMKELLPDDEVDVMEFGMGQAGILLPSPNANNFSQENKSVMLEKSYQIAATSKESHGFGMLQQHKLGNQSSSFMVNGQESINVVQHSDQLTSHKQIMQPPQKMQPQPNLQRTAFLHSQNVMAIDQKMTANQSQPIHIGSYQGLLNHNSQVGSINPSEWVDPAFQQIQFMKDMYLFEVIKLFERSQELRHQATNAESVSRHERNRSFAEKVIKFLQVSKMDLLKNYTKEKVYSIINEVRANLDRSIATNRIPLHRHPQQHVEMSGSMLKTSQMQQRPNFLQYRMPNQCLNTARNGMPLSLRQQGTTKFQGSSSAGIRKGEASSITNANAYNLMGSGFQKGVEQMARNVLPHPLSGTAKNNVTDTLHQRVASSKNIFNPLDSPVSSITQKTISISPQQNKQWDQAMEISNLKQPLQQPLAENNKRQMVPKLNNDLKKGYIPGFNQNQSSPSSYHVGSPQNSQHTPAYIEPKGFLSTFSNSATPLLSTPSPPVVPSPQTPVTPSPMPVHFEKCHSKIHSSSIEEGRKVHQMPAALSQPKIANQIQNEEAGLPKSPLLAESTTPVINQPSRDKEYPLGRLIEVVKSVSTRTLNSSLRDICAVTKITDRTARILSHSESDRIFIQDLADDIRNYEAGNIGLTYGTAIEARMKRQLSTMVSDDSTSEIDRNGDSWIKRLKIEPSNPILQEVKEINHVLIESVVDVINMNDVSRAESSKVILIRCCYRPVGLAGETGIPGSSEKMFPSMLLELNVTPDYPNSSPVVSEALPLDFSGDEKGKGLWMKAKSIFSLSLRKCSHPISLKEMVKTWDASARKVFQEFAEQMGGGSFSSRYGKWENDTSLFPVT
ncbi:mediator of RNA polymerase II transcription subunit 15a-like [Dorcoceras hygrometricum]|nr:mediator of RNA polymerase II transcription subunit 15a-like [Dorcoceras hygrometricum]